MRGEGSDFLDAVWTPTFQTSRTTRATTTRRTERHPLLNCLSRYGVRHFAPLEHTRIMNSVSTAQQRGLANPTPASSYLFCRYGQKKKITKFGQSVSPKEFFARAQYSTRYTVDGRTVSLLGIGHKFSGLQVPSTAARIQQGLLAGSTPTVCNQHFSIVSSSTCHIRGGLDEFRRMPVLLYMFLRCNGFLSHRTLSLYLYADRLGHIAERQCYHREADQVPDVFADFAAISLSSPNK